MAACRYSFIRLAGGDSTVTIYNQDAGTV